MLVGTYFGALLIGSSVLVLDSNPATWKVVMPEPAADMVGEVQDTPLFCNEQVRPVDVPVVPYWRVLPSTAVPIAQ